MPGRHSAAALASKRARRSIVGQVDRRLRRSATLELQPFEMKAASRAPSGPVLGALRWPWTLGTGSTPSSVAPCPKLPPEPAGSRQRSYSARRDALKARKRGTSVTVSRNDVINASLSPLALENIRQLP